MSIYGEGVEGLVACSTLTTPSINTIIAALLAVCLYYRIVYKLSRSAATAPYMPFDVFFMVLATRWLFDFFV